MKKKNFSKLALKGITAGLLLSTTAIQAAQGAGFGAQGCGGSAPSQGYGVQTGNTCSAAAPVRGNTCSANQPRQGYYQNQQGQSDQYYSQGNPQNQNRMQNQYNRQQNPSQLSAGCGAKGKCGAIAIGDAPTKVDNQRGYDTSYESSWDYDHQNKNDAMIPSDKSKTQPQGKYLADNQTTIAQKPMTEADLLKKLDTQGKATYNSLSPKGKALALSLANEDNGNKYADKNLAVRIAADKTASEKKLGN